MAKSKASMKLTYANNAVDKQKRQALQAAHAKKYPTGAAAAGGGIIGLYSTLSSAIGNALGSATEDLKLTFESEGSLSARDVAKKFFKDNQDNFPSGEHHIDDEALDDDDEEEDDESSYDSAEEGDDEEGDDDDVSTLSEDEDDDVYEDDWDGRSSSYHDIASSSVVTAPNKEDFFKVVEKYNDIAKESASSIEYKTGYSLPKMIGNKEGLELDFPGVDERAAFFATLATEGVKFTACDDDGKPLAFSDGDGVLHSKGEVDFDDAFTAAELSQADAPTSLLDELDSYSNVYEADDEVSNDGEEEEEEEEDDEGDGLSSSGSSKTYGAK